MLGQQIFHVWYDKDEKLDHVWIGRLIRQVKASQTKDPNIAVKYWQKNEDEQDGVESHISVYKLAADLFSGDLWLL